MTLTPNLTQDTLTPDLVKKLVNNKPAVIVSEEQVWSLYQTSMPADYPVFLVKPGEQAKSIETWSQLIGFLASHRCQRDTMLIALGGGVIGDLTGFCAATYMRGIDYMQIPTSLLAQVDASVGGKTAINHAKAKNLVGAFYQPTHIIIDTALLVSLSKRQFLAGLAEVIKIALIADHAFFNWLNQHLTQILAFDPATLTAMVMKAIRLKQTIVKQDFYDKGQRQLLNFGHTVGHAIEAQQQYQGLLHGEAVALGMMVAVELSTQRGLLNAEQSKLIHLLFQRAEILPPWPSNISPQQLIHTIQLDKKAEKNQQVMILLTNIGKGVRVLDVSTDEIVNACQQGVLHGNLS